MELYANALDKIKAFPNEYYQERAEALKRSAICFIGNEQYDEALEAVRTAHREVAKMPNGEATTELLRWNLTYQMARGLQKKSKFSRSSSLASAVLREIKMRVKKAEEEGKPWSNASLRKVDALSTALEKAISQNKSLMPVLKPQGQYLMGQTKVWQDGLFGDTDKSRIAIAEQGRKSRRS